LNPEHYTEYTAKGFFKIFKNHFDSVEILGLRAEKEIEEIEKNRIKKSFLRSFIIRPSSTFLKSIFPSFAIQKLKEVKSKLNISRRTKEPRKQSNFNELATTFSFNDFCFTSNSLDESQGLLAICKRGKFEI